MLCSVSFTCGHYAAIWRHSTSYSGTVVSLQLSVHTSHKYQPYFSWLQWEQTAWELDSACSTVPFYQCESAAAMSSFFSAWGLTNLRRLPRFLSSRPWNFLCISQPLGDNLRLWLSVSDTDGNVQDNIQGRELNIITYLVFRDDRAGNDLKNRQIHLY